MVGGDPLDKALHDLAAVAKTKNQPGQRHQARRREGGRGTFLHVISVPIPADAENREKVVQMIGETADVAVGSPMERCTLRPAATPWRR